MPTHPRKIYLLSPKELSPETIAVTFAKTSRSPETFREIAADLNDEKSAEFHEKWVVGYGHASVAEHAVLHIAIENVSRMAVESIESNRLASFTEKSTRYQKWGSDDFIIPLELEENPQIKKGFLRVCRLLFKTYTQSLSPVRDLVAKQNPRRENETEESYDRRIRSQYVDSCRFLLPAASLANVGMTANARVLENSIRKMLSHPLQEVREIGVELKTTCRAELPSLVKYAESSLYLKKTREQFTGEAESLKETKMKVPLGGLTDWCQLIDYDPQGEVKVMAAVLYHYAQMPYQQVLETLKSTPSSERNRLAGELMGNLDIHDNPPRELEHTSYTFDLILDQGGYAEFKRHRIMTQTPQPLTGHLGYVVPRKIFEAGVEASYRSAMEEAAKEYDLLVQWNPHVASYVIPNGFNRRVLFTMNLREAYAFCRLRAATNAHFSIRRVARKVAEEIARVHPLLASSLLPTNETWMGIEEQFMK